MATKATKRTTVTTSASVSSSSGGYASGKGRPSSPLSPTRFSRLQEKEELQHLNDRLAVYIERVRQLEHENSRLITQVQSSQETVTREVNSIKSMYESELSDARKLLDETAKEKAKLQIDCGKYKAENEELLAKYTKKEKDLIASEKNVIYYENKMQDLQSRVNQLVSDRKRLEDELKEVKSERDKLRKQLEALQKQLEDETLARVDLENRIQSLKEELTFKQQVHEQELTETRTTKQVEITEIDGRLQQQYELKLADSLRELREQYEAQLRINREEIETMYETKLQEVRKLGDLNLGSAASAREELRQSRLRIENLTARLSELESQNAAFANRIKDLERQMEDERNSHLSLMASRDEEIRQLQDLLAQQFREYQDLMDIKIALDMELAAYRKLLENEEARLNITPLKSPREQQIAQGRGTPVRRTPVGARGVKRKRTILSQAEEMASNKFVSTASAKGEVEVIEHDTEGKFVKIHNKGEKDINIGGWQLLRKAGDQDTTYKFHRSINLKAGQTTTVWSADSEQTHNPPSDLVMKGQKWVIGDNMITTLVNNSGEEMAQRETTRQVLSSSYLRSSEGGYLDDGEEGDPQNPERCSIM